MQTIIEKLSRERTIETIIHRMAQGREDDEDMKDLEQDIYLILLEKGEAFLRELDSSNQLNFFIASCVKKQLHSSTSPYYIKYKKFRKLSSQITDQQL